MPDGAVSYPSGGAGAADRHACAERCQEHTLPELRRRLLADWATPRAGRIRVPITGDGAPNRRLRAQERIGNDLIGDTSRPDDPDRRDLALSQARERVILTPDTLSLGRRRAEVGRLHAQEVAARLRDGPVLWYRPTLQDIRETMGLVRRPPAANWPRPFVVPPVHGQHASGVSLISTFDQKRSMSSSESGRIFATPRIARRTTAASRLYRRASSSVNTPCIARWRRLRMSV
jgi:hypothetical protein